MLNNKSGIKRIREVAKSIGFRSGGAGWYRILQTPYGEAELSIISLHITNRWGTSRPMHLYIDIIFSVWLRVNDIEYKGYGNTSSIPKVRLTSIGETSTSIGYIDFYFNGYKYDDNGNDHWNFVLYDNSYTPIVGLLSDTEYLGKLDTPPEGETLVKLVQFEY